LPVPSGVEVQVDGHALARLPLLRDPHPLVLAHGRHTFAWDSKWLPFRGLKCGVSVPPVLGVDTCPLQGAHPRGWVVTLQRSLAARAPGRAQGLTAGIRAAPAKAAFTATARVGDHYSVGTDTPPESAVVATATAPLRATLHFGATVPEFVEQEPFLGEP